jgi:hypothetical protein
MWLFLSIVVSVIPARAPRRSLSNAAHSPHFVRHLSMCLPGSPVNHFNYRRSVRSHCDITGIDATPVVHAVEILIRMPLYWAVGILRAMEKAASVKVIRHRVRLMVDADAGTAVATWNTVYGHHSPTAGAREQPVKSRSAQSRFVSGF